jgi:SEC-C motif-containing protein
MSTVCPCRKLDKIQLTYEECCAPFITHQKLAPTAESLMRARYTAYAKLAIDFVDQTQIAVEPNDFNKDEALKWAQGSEWLGLEIKSKSKGEEKDLTGIVEFIAHYKDKESGKDLIHHETSLFSHEKDGWKFKQGNIHGAQPQKRLEVKIGRNDPCSCGSGKKYKKCCG